MNLLLFWKSLNQAREKKMTWVSIGQIAQFYGVTCQTIRNWEKEGMFTVKRTKGGHRRFLLEEITGTADEAEKTVIYSRVSSHEQKPDLKRQSEGLLEYCHEKGFEQIEAVEEVGSGMNYRKRGLRKLIAQIIRGEVKRIVVNFKDRLMRFGKEILAQLCALKRVEIIEVSEPAEMSFEQDLVNDVLMIMTVYTSKIYGKRAHRNRRKRMQTQAV